MMVGEGVDGDLGPGEPRSIDDWPSPTTNIDVTNKDGSSSRFLFLTVQYVGEEAGATGLENLSELEQRVVSPLDPNMGCTACYSPVYGSNTPLMVQPAGSPSGGYLNVSSPPSTSTGLQDQGMIVLNEPCQLSETDNYVMSTAPQPGRVFSDDGKLVLFADDTHPTEITTGGNGEQRVELLLSNGTILYGIVEALDSNGYRIVEIPREYVVAPRPPNTEIEEETRQDIAVPDENVQDENGHLRALYNTLQEQGLIIESEDLQVEAGESLIDTSLLEQTSTLPQHPSPPPQKRFWCEECNQLLDSECREHQINRKISDKAVPSRARATLPASYLAINNIPDSDIEEYGVFARKTIPKRTQFGPMEGVTIKTEDITVMHEGPHLELTIETESGELQTLDVSNENLSNWMRFVRIATPERPPNLLVSQLGSSLFFTSTHSIHAKDELLVWYSPAYAIRRNLPANPPPPVWSCLTCGEKLKTQEELMNHSTVHIKKSKREENLTVNRLRCKNQALVATVNKDITERNSQSSQRTRFECAVCSKKFPRSCSLKRHILLLHTRENKYYCKLCPMAFSHTYNRLRHMRKSHPNHKETAPKHVANQYQSWSCSRCKLTFTKSSILNIHKLVHTPVEENSSENSTQEHVSCPQCCEKFSNSRMLANHVAKHGKRKDSLDKDLHCEVCGRNFVSALRFQNHIEQHGDNGSKPLKCHICMRGLLTTSALSCHLKSHDCSAQWECPMCKEHFSNVLDLRTHVHTHAVKGLYRCPHCDKAFQEYSGIRKHVRAFHSARNHPCKDCGKCFPSRDKLRMHLLRHSDRREFLCANCGKQFKRKDKLREHMKRMHSSSEKDDSVVPGKVISPDKDKKNVSKFAVNMSDYEHYIYKCHSCVLGFKRRGMLVNHLANRHPDISPESVPELNLPILKTTRDYYCQYCDKIYKSSSKRKAHILKNHPGLELPMSNRQIGGVPDIPGLPNPTFSQTVGSVTTNPHGCQWCHKQYASKAKLLQHQRKKHAHLLPSSDQTPRALKKPEHEEDLEMDAKDTLKVIYEDMIDEEPFPIALSTGINHPISSALNHLQEYEIVTTEYDAAGIGVLVDSSSVVKKSTCKNDMISSDLLSQAMSEIGVSLSEFRTLSSEQYLKMVQSPVSQDSLYTPYPAR